MMNGTTKLQTTIVQKSGANEPFCVTFSACTSALPLPYQTVSRSAKMK